MAVQFHVTGELVMVLLDSRSEVVIWCTLPIRRTIEVSAIHTSFSLDSETGTFAAKPGPDVVGEFLVQAVSLLDGLLQSVENVVLYDWQLPSGMLVVDTSQAALE